MIIPYSSETLTWHLSSNVFGLSPQTIDGIVRNCQSINEGNSDLDEEMLTGCGFTNRDMLDDLQIDYNN